MEFESEIKLDINTACSLGDEDFLKYILNHECADVNIRNSYGWTPLMYACWGHHEGVATRLLSAGANRQQLNNDKQSALLLAAKSGSLQLTKLVYQKSILNDVDKFGKTALYYSVEFGYRDIASFLLMEGADANISCEGMTPLMVAAVSGQRPLVELLLSHGAERGAHNKQGFTANQLAYRHSHLDLANLLAIRLHDITDLKSLLESLSLDKYWPIFETHNMDLQKFLQLDEDDLKCLGIKLLGPRRKMSMAIASVLKRQSLL